MAKLIPVNLSLGAEWVEYLRDVVWWTRTTLVDILDEGARLELAALEKAHNKGKPFPPIGDEPRPIQRPRGGEKKTNLPTKLDEDLQEELKRAAYWCSLPYSAIIVAGTDKVIRQLEQKHNAGEKFGKRERELAKNPRKKDDK